MFTINVTIVEKGADLFSAWAENIRNLDEGESVKEGR